VVSNKLSRRRSYAGTPKVCKAPPAVPPVPPPPPPPWPPTHITGHIHVIWDDEGGHHDRSAEYDATDPEQVGTYLWQDNPQNPTIEVELTLLEPQSALVLHNWADDEGYTGYAECNEFPINWGQHELYFCDDWDYTWPEGLEAHQTIQT